MIVSHLHRFIFLRVPKTASTSLSIALSKFCGPDDTITPIAQDDEVRRRELGHRGPQNYLRPWYTYGPSDWRWLISRGKWPRYKHAGVREARRFVGEAVWGSYFKFCVERNPFDRAISAYYYRSKFGPVPDLNEYICSLKPRHLSNWHQYTTGDRLAVDLVVRYEQLPVDLAVVSARLGLPEITLPATKVQYRRDRRHYSEVLNEAARRHIEQACAKEIAAFSYEWTVPGPESRVSGS